VHDVWYSRQLGGYPEPTEEERKVRPPCYHRLVQYHHGSGRKTLYLASHASHIVGMPIEEGRALLKRLIEMATPADAIYRHRWPGRRSDGLGQPLHDASGHGFRRLCP